MIIRPASGSQLLITQPDHAALAAGIMRQWVVDGLPESPRRSAILHATAEHDNGWSEVDAAPMADEATGRILDFINAPESVRQGVWPRGVARLSGTPYAAALVASHALHVYRRFREEPAWAAFFETMTRARDRQLEASGAATLAELASDYAFVRIGDLASLTFCNGWVEVQTDEFGYTIRLEGNRLEVVPDPFAGRAFDIEIVARELPDRSWEDSDLERAFQAATPVILRGVVSGGVRTA